MTTYGYARVSTKDQNLDRQLDALEGFPVELCHVFTDQVSGKDFDRPGYSRLLRRLGEGDVLVICSIDRLGRNYDEIIEQWRLLTKCKGVDLVVLDMPLLDTRAKADGVTGVFISDIVLQLLSYVAQIEREKIHQRQAEGIAAARARGVKFGRPAKERPATFGEVYERFANGDESMRSAAACLGVSRSTFGKWIDGYAPPGVQGSGA